MSESNEAYEWERPRHRALRRQVPVLPWLDALYCPTDKASYFRFGAAQDPRAQPLLDGHGLGDITASTIVLIEGDKVYLRSTAALRIARRLGLPWSLLSVFLIVPRALRDMIYDIVSNLRYRIAGTTDSCEVPSEALRQRMI